MAQERNDLLQGTLDLLILRVLNSGRNHGYAIARRIELISKDALSIQQGSLYPALHRLEAQKWIKAEWDLTDTGRRARFYRLTAAGERRLTEETSYWRQFAAAIDLVLRHG